MRWALLGLFVVAVAAQAVTYTPARPKPVSAGCCLKDGKCEQVASDEGCDRDTYYMTGFCHDNVCEPS